jgi:transcriptional regulator with XRE-family HTH domain
MVDGDCVSKCDASAAGTAFAVLVQRLRHEAWLTQEELAEKSGLSPRTIQAIERGKVGRPHRESVRLLANALALRGTARAEFEAAARRPSPGGDRADQCPLLGRLAGWLGCAADPDAVLACLLHALATNHPDVIATLKSGYGFTGSPVLDHTLPVQVLPGA